MDIQRITTYSLLAHINNSNIGINDLSEIFIPLVKRVLSQMNSEGFSKGASLEEIKNRVDNIFKLDIPYPLLKKIVTKIASDENKDGEVNFAYYKDGSFIIKNFVFADYEEIIQDQEFEIKFLQDTYENYLAINRIDKSAQPSIFEFLDSNRISLSQYFANKTEHQPTLEYSIQANFINSVKDIPKIYNVLRKVYLGSIITSYLEVDYGNIKKNVEFLIDTNFIVALLDLNSIESKHTCRKIVEICQRLGYTISVLDFTIEETESLINRTAQNYENTFLAKKIDPESIYNACDRRNLSKTDLQAISANLVDRLSKEFKIGLVPNTTKYRNEAKHSSEYHKFKEFRPSEFSALHDATAVIYVQKKRGKKISNFQDSNCWFVTNVSHEISHLKNDGFIPEIIRAEDLVNLLWLTNPMVKATETIDIGLTRLISCAISNSLPSARVIKELDENIQKYAKDKVDPKDVVRIANMIANKTISNLEELNKKARTNSDDFVKTLQELSDIEKKNEEKRQSEIKSLLIKIKTESESKFKQSLEEIKETHSKIVEDLRTTSSKEQKNKLSQKEFESKTRQLEEYKKSFTSIDNIKTSYDILSEKIASRWLFVIIVLPICISTYFFFLVSWTKFEPWTFIIGVVPIIVSYSYFAITKQEIGIKVIWLDIKGRAKNKYYKRHNFDINHYHYLQTQIDELESELIELPNR